VKVPLRIQKECACPAGVLTLFDTEAVKVGQVWLVRSITISNNIAQGLGIYPGFNTRGKRWEIDATSTIGASRGATQLTYLYLYEGDFISVYLNVSAAGSVLITISGELWYTEQELLQPPPLAM